MLIYKGPIPTGVESYPKHEFSVGLVWNDEVGSHAEEVEGQSG